MAEGETPLDVVVLGSGTCVPSLRRSACALLVCIGADRLLFDVGPGTLRRLLEAGVGHDSLSHLFLSHWHPDHTGELVPLLFATKYPQCRRATPLVIAGGPGLSDFFQRLEGVYGHWIQLPPGCLRLDEMRAQGPDQRAYGGFRIDTRPMRHNPESIAYRVTAPGGRSVVYSGDTAYSEELVALAGGADLLICESAFPEAAAVPGHLTPAQAGEIARSAGVRQLMLTHFYPVCDTADVLGECRRTYNGPLLLAEDLMRIRVG
jgi:ribonuclease BN (tRNA processing enzyme)